MRYFSEPDLYDPSKENKPKLCKDIGLFEYCVNLKGSKNLKHQIYTNNIYTDLKIFSFKYKLMATAGTLFYTRIKQHHNFKEYYNVNKEDFLELYSKNRNKIRKDHPIQQLMDLCKDKNNNQCYYCGAKDFENIDHFLPEGKINSSFDLFFPQLCVMSYNLVPSCGTCNRKKLKHVGEYATETFIHPYFSGFLNDIFLNCETSFHHNNEPTFSYTVSYPNNWLLSQKKRVEWQLNKLDILNRYSLKASSNLKKNLIECQEILKIDGIGALKIHLDRRARSIAGYLGVNNWERLMYLSLSNNIHRFSIYLRNTSNAQTKAYLNPLDINKLRNHSN